MQNAFWKIWSVAYYVIELNILADITIKNKQMEENLYSFSWNIAKHGLFILGYVNTTYIWNLIFKHPTNHLCSFTYYRFSLFNILCANKS